MDAPRLQFGLVPPPSDGATAAQVDELLHGVSERAGLVLVRRQVAGYDDLARLLRGGVLHVAWLPPILFARLDVEGVVRELVCADRGEDAPYVSALVARASSGLATIEDLRGKRVGWVDPLSAAGYVVPRLRLAHRGMPPSSLFAEETFFGSHAAVVRAVLDGAVDVGATYAGFGPDGELARSAFAEAGAGTGELAVVEAFGAIPSDVVAVHASVSRDVAAALGDAFEEAGGDPALRDVVRDAFGARGFTRRPLAGHDLLRAEIALERDAEVIPAAAAFLSSRPPRP